jgi:serine/threonine protein kinase
LTCHHTSTYYFRQIGGPSFMSYIDRKLGDYRIVAKIGHGAMGEIYRAHDERNNRDVELRVFLGDVFTDESSFQKFRNEVLTLAKLNHPNVQSVFEFGRQAGVDFLATELILGQTVSKKLEEGPLPEREIFGLGKQLAEGLAAAHKQGVVHRDLKSSSLMVTPEGRLKIRDFLEAPSSVFGSTREGATVGTLAYMSPEKLRRQADDERSDIYAAGAVLYEMATSRTPFAQRENADLMRAIIEETPVPPHSLNPNVSPPLEAVIARSLDKDPAKRFGSARELSIALLFAEAPIDSANFLLATRIQREAMPDDSEIKEIIEKLRAESPQTSTPPASPILAEKEIGSPPIKIKADDSFDPVHFAVTCSHTVVPASSFVLNVWAYLQIHQGEVERQAKNALGGAKPYVQSVGPSKVARGTVLSVSLRIDELTADALEGTILWDGEIGNVTFSISVPNGISSGIKSGFATIHVGSFRIAAIHFFITIGRKATSSHQVFSRGVKHRTAFASYASEDRDAVLARIQGIQKVAPKLEVFLDVLNLRSGEDWSKRLCKEITSRDIFYLFWSESASRSNWVEMEWRCALEARGLDFIDPVPLVSPSKVPPPRELASRHFNDWVLAFMRGQQSN